MLENAVSATGMGMVIHGMSTALSTTITAIVCYVFFGYMFQRLTDAQTNLISGVEQVTTAFLMPKFQVQTDNVLYEFTGLIRRCRDWSISCSSRRSASKPRRISSPTPSRCAPQQGRGTR